MPAEVSHMYTKWSNHQISHPKLFWWAWARRKRGMWCKTTWCFILQLWCPQWTMEVAKILHPGWGSRRISAHSLGQDRGFWGPLQAVPWQRLGFMLPFSKTKSTFFLHYCSSLWFRPHIVLPSCYSFVSVMDDGRWKALGVPCRYYSLPIEVFKLLGKLLGIKNLYRLCRFAWNSGYVLWHIQLISYYICLNLRCVFLTSSFFRGLFPNVSCPSLHDAETVFPQE